MIITVIEIIIAALLVGSIMLQQRGTQAGVVFGGSSQTYRSKRGLEKVLFYLTIIFAGLFAGVSILGILI